MSRRRPRWWTDGERDAFSIWEDLRRGKLYLYRNRKVRGHPVVADAKKYLRRK